VSGIVRGSDIAGKLPTKDASIYWFLVNNPSVDGFASTDADGKYEFLVQVRLDFLFGVFSSSRTP
jgi:hypothetical protein